MAKFVFGMNQSLDGYIDHENFPPRPLPKLFQHNIERIGAIAGSLYGRKVYEAMQYWDEDRPEWDLAQHAFARAWRGQHKWVVSSRLTSIGPKATLAGSDLEATARSLKAEIDGVIEVNGPTLAQGLTELGLIDEYWMYLHPCVLGSGTPFFKGPRPGLRLKSHEVIDADVVRLVYLPEL